MVERQQGATGERPAAKQLVFDALSAGDTVSRVGLARRWGLRLATVTEVTRELLEDGLIMEAGEEASTGGRRPVLLRMNHEAFHVVGAHVEHRMVRCALYSSGMEIIGESSLELSPEVDNQALAAGVAAAVKGLLGELGFAPAKVKAIGVAFPGRVDAASGVCRGGGVLKNVMDCPARDLLEAVFKVPVAIDHDVAAMAIAEHKLGLLDAARNSCLLYIGQGVGAKFALDGKLYRGAANGAGEFGHMRLRDDGPQCHCGKRGCFESLASVAAIVRDFGGKASFSEIVSLAEGGDVKADRTLQDAAKLIGEAVGDIFYFMDIEQLVVAGEIVLAEPLIGETLRRSVVWHDTTVPRKILFSRQGSEVAMAGMALQAARPIYAKAGVELCGVA